MASKKIVIGFDVSAASGKGKSGVGYYTAGLLDALAINYPDDLEVVGHYFNFLGKTDTSSLPIRPNIRYRRTLWAPKQLFTMLRRVGIPISYEFFLKQRVDFQLFPNFIGWPSLFRTPSAATIHDLYYLEHPEQVSKLNQHDLQKLVPKTLRRSAFIIAISNATRQALQKAYPNITKPVVISHIPPVAMPRLPEAESKRLVSQLGVEGKFILFVGNVEPRKNLVGLLEAYEQLPQPLQDEFVLVIAGGKGWKDEDILAKLSELQSRGLNIIRTGYVSEEQKAALYREAALFVLPSLYEGFGMPLLEAMSYDTPVLASDIPVFREVAGDAVLYCNPMESKDITSKLELLLLDTQLQRDLTTKGSKQLGNFSWQATAEKIYQAIRKEVGSK
jgi:glycosyltransferase involved in cell wall biosynthesis